MEEVKEKRKVAATLAGEQHYGYRISVPLQATGGGEKPLQVARSPVDTAIAAAGLHGVAAAVASAS